jgi:hypothetical protein
MGDGDLRTTLVVGARLLCGWACVAMALLDLLMGVETGPYLVFHLVLLAGGLFLLGLGKLPKPLKPFEYAVITSLAIVTTVATALPTSDAACCMRGLDVRHGYPLTLLGWNHGRPVHFAPAHTFAALTFWFLAWLLLRVFVGTLRPRREAPAAPPSTHAEDRAAGPWKPDEPQQGQTEQGQPEQGQPEQGQPEQGQPEQGQPEQGRPGQADDESVGGLP